MRNENGLRKPLPSMASSPSAGTAVGVSFVIVGVNASRTVKGRLFTLTMPALIDGTITTCASGVVERTVAAVEPKVTLSVVRKCEPLMVTLCPGAADDGSMLVTTGAGSLPATYVKPFDNASPLPALQRGF